MSPEPRRRSFEAVIHVDLTDCLGGGVMQRLLKVKWRDSEELILFDEDKVFDELKTFERWGDSTEVTYNAGAIFKKNKNERTLQLTYEYKNQTDRKLKKQGPDKIPYGSSVINWVDGETKGKAYWKDGSRADRDGEVEVSVRGGKLQVDKRKKSVLVTTRPRQMEFRNDLLTFDKQCVLTGETCPTVLEAAHLVPVTKMGHDHIGNGILLRADLHLLFDAGLIWFKVLKDRAVVECSVGVLTDHYVKTLNGKSLPNETFERVKDALEVRAKLPGGRGRSATGQ